MSKKVLITGANGYIGKHVVKSVLDTGAKAIACDLNADGIDNRAEIITTDILSPSPELFKKLGKPDICLHLAWQDGFLHNAESHMENLSRHYEFIKNMLNNGIKQLVVMGTMHEIGYHEGAIDETTPCNPGSMYGIAKDALRRSTFLMVQSKDIVVQWLRAYYVYGDDLRNQSIFTKLLQAAHEGKKSFPFNTGKNKYDFIHVEELARQIVAVAMQTKETGIVNCCSGKAISLSEKVEEFIKEHGLDIKLEYGAFPDRAYDSSAVWGDGEKISKIITLS